MEIYCEGCEATNETKHIMKLVISKFKEDQIIYSCGECLKTTHGITSLSYLLKALKIEDHEIESICLSSTVLQQ